MAGQAGWLSDRRGEAEETRASARPGIGNRTISQKLVLSPVARERRRHRNGRVAEAPEPARNRTRVDAQSARSPCQFGGRRPRIGRIDEITTLSNLKSQIYLLPTTHHRVNFLSRHYLPCPGWATGLQFASLCPQGNG